MQKNLLMLFVAISALFVGCSNDDDYYVSLVTVAEDDSGSLLFMRSDSLLLYPTNFNIVSKVGQRILIEYHIKGSEYTDQPYDYKVHINDYDLVLTKDATTLTLENEEEIGNDAFWNIFDMNPGGGFLNVYLSFLYNYNPHTINLVANEITPPVNSADTINLELRQNANGENIGYPVRELVSFNVSSYLDAARDAGVEELVLAIKVNMGQNNYSVFNVPFKTMGINTSTTEYNSLSAVSSQSGYVD